MGGGKVMEVLGADPPASRSHWRSGLQPPALGDFCNFLLCIFSTK